MTSRTNALPLIAGRWALDSLHSSVGFAIRHLGVSKVRGRFTAFDAELVVGETLADSSITATVELASIDTGNADRDAHVLANDMLDVEKRPTMSFRSTGIRGDGEEWTLDGELTIGEVTRQISFAVEFGGVEDVFDGSRHAGFEATGQIRRSDFGIGFGAGEAILGDVVKIQLDVQFVEPAE
ncbi:Polyisoprenoid-binding protein YceI [Saccharopolyspora kobensis]|uniref:Polyisoprenoid-binding protein YceI n=1 Tax=Saccharopolyspora kobensis TaxID=146035 RepID=A0A1H6ELG4_9PSEU|nr:YceI family protein [Saccharopolyspora kobensis]SEG97659.1 Polyisoprenoid-binding protein YceI [Saccharopolyspora kobensis]SFE92264.1 Polyisoprenoid-binding protein YceI [Saccharopolyspora kobensis]